MKKHSRDHGGLRLLDEQQLRAVSGGGQGIAGGFSSFVELEGSGAGGLGFGGGSVQRTSAELEGGAIGGSNGHAWVA